MKFLKAYSTSRFVSDQGRSRAAILGRLRAAYPGKAVVASVKPPAGFFPAPSVPLAYCFKQELEALGGKVVLVERKEALSGEIEALLTRNRWGEVACPEEGVRRELGESGLTRALVPALSEKTEVVITGCEALVAGTGSVVVSSAQAGSRRMFVYPPVHLVVAALSALAETLEEAYDLVLNRYSRQMPSMLTIITGPSRTADIEKTLVLGAHGPKELYVFLYDYNH